MVHHVLEHSVRCCRASNSLRRKPGALRRRGGNVTSTSVTFNPKTLGTMLARRGWGIFPQRGTTPRPENLSSRRKDPGRCVLEFEKKRPVDQLDGSTGLLGGLWQKKFCAMRAVANVRFCKSCAAHGVRSHERSTGTLGVKVAASATSARAPRAIRDQNTFTRGSCSPD